MAKKLAAIDLYSGVGGWTIGLKLAGIDVKRCYEWWDRAIETYNQNLSPIAHSVNIRELDPRDIDVRQVDVVVGSPPCTQFSFSNRGGQGDLADGLKDIAKFLEIVKALKPKHWAMENVPRVSKILARELAPGGQLTEYADLVKVNLVVDASEFGLPQRRKRMIAGDFPVDLFLSYRAATSTLRLGDVLTSLHRHGCDPIYKSAPGLFSEMEIEEPLGDEEMRINRDAKRFHPVYNRMPFPDPLNKPARTVTALCTRVSRESIVIEDPERPGSYRRPTVRERASLQGFPATYQFFGKSYSDKLKMVGNAVPPVLTYFLANAMLGRDADSVTPLARLAPPNKVPKASPRVTQPSSKGRSFPSNRRFRAAIPSLRFGSGMRFELTNELSGRKVQWFVDFYFGPSKAFERVRADKATLSSLKGSSCWKAISLPFARGQRLLSELLREADANSLQRAWSGRDHSVGPFEVCDTLGRWADSMVADLDSIGDADLETALFRVTRDPGNGGRRKLIKNARAILAGFAVAGWFNGRLVPVGMKDGDDATPKVQSA